MRLLKAMETVTFKLSERTLTVLGYYAVLPFYLWAQILFGETGPDPLGKYGYLVETGVAKYV